MNIIKLKELPSQGLAGLTIAGLLFSMIGFAPIASAATTADISASVTPTSVNSGATQEFDISVSNGVSATSSIDVITVSEALAGWTIDTGSIECPFAWTVSSSSADGFTCTAGTTIFGSADIDPGSTGHVIFTATAPTVTSDTDTIWNLYFQDSDGGESNTPDVHFTILADTGTPPPTATTTAAGSAVITASIMPTTVNSGATQEFDLTVSNGAAALTSIDHIMITETLNFSFDSGSIECPAGWTLGSITSEGFSCTASGTSTDIDAGGSAHVIFTATAPVMEEDANTLWNLYFGDSDGGEYNTPDVHFTINGSGVPVPPTTHTGAVISASVVPTTVVSGQATAFDITVSNGASATSSIDAVIVSEVHNFSFDTGTITCPSGWTLSGVDGERFVCSANSASTTVDIDPGSSAHVTFTATAPAVTATTSSLWNLWFGDSDGGESNTPDVHFTIIPAGATTTGTTTPPTTGTTTPPTSTGTTTAATSSPVITLNGDATVTAFDCNGYTELGATAVDSTGSSTPVTITSNVNIDEEGTYTVTYTATDSAGRTATATRTVIVEACGSGGGSSAPADTSTPSGSVLGAFTENPPGFIGVVGPVVTQSPAPAPQVLGAFTPGIPSTGVDDTTAQSSMMLAASLTLLAVGIAYLSRKKTG